MNVKIVVIFLLRMISSDICFRGLDQRVRTVVVLVVEDVRLTKT